MNLSRHTSAFICASLLLVPCAAFGQAQDQPGIDLTTPSAPSTSPEEVLLPSSPAPEAAKPGAKADRSEAGPPREAASPAGSGAASPIAPGEGDVALVDRVKAIQRKGFLKRHRFEVGANVAATVNDAFYEKLGGTAKLAYNFEDSFALAVRGTHFVQIRTAHVKEGKQAFSSQLLNSQLSNLLMLDGIWSPIYGKVSWLGSSIIHFDMYLLAGAGAAWSATSVAPRNEGPHIAADLGFGIRFYPSHWIALEGGVVGTFYPDQPNLSVPSTMQKVITAQFGISFFLPLNFEYVYP